jgi:hypothetical protein
VPATGQRPNSAFDEYIKKISADKKAPTRTTSATFRRWVGIGAGAAVGLAYGLGAQHVNRIATGAPLYQPPLGPLGNVLLIMAVAALIGLATAWPAKSMAGIALGALVGMALLQIRSWALPDTMAIFEQMGLVSNLVFDLIALPLAFLIALPLSLVLRWLVVDTCDHRGQAWFTWRRLRLPVVVLAVVAFVGTWSSYPRAVRETIRSMDALVKTGLAAQSPNQVPAPLQTGVGRGLLNSAIGDYQLEWDTGVARLSSGDAGLGAVSQGGGPTTIRARFENGYAVSCRFNVPSGTPTCREEWVGE